MLQSFGATPFQIFRYVTLPETVPALLLGLRLALALSLVVSIVAEMFIGTSAGLGQRIYEAYMMGAVDDLYAHLLAVGALGFFSASVLQHFEKRSLRWAGE
jgi:NitT/TauT family transport system permease protein